MPSWIFIALLGGLVSNLGNFLFRYLLKEGDDYTAYAWFYQAFRFIFFLIVSIFSFSFVGGIKGILILLVLGLGEISSAYFLMAMHSHSHLSISTIIARTRIIWIPLIAFFVFNETLNTPQYFGIAILFTGLSIAVSPGKILVDKGIKLAFMSSISAAVVNILMKASSDYASPPVLAAAMSLPSVLLFPIFMKNPKKRIVSSLKINLPIKILTGFVNVSSMYLLIKALSLGPAGIVAGLYQSMMITSVVAGIFVLGEKEDIGKKIIGTLITIVGVILLTAI
jgi:drug/metabolite transporter (DMT)-like permease